MHLLQREDPLAEQQNNSTERSETVDPRNPPNSVLSPKVREAAFWVYFGPLLAICVIVGIALLYWMTRDEPNEDVTAPIGTAGEQTPGGGSPDPRPDSTSEEIKNRGGR